MRTTAHWIGALALATFLAGGGAQAQLNYDRRGGDYTNFTVRNGDPSVCAARCEREARCRAWSFSFPRTTFAPATCWLKSRVPPRNEDQCCISGVRGAGIVEPRVGAAEFSIDRFGGDYRHVEVQADPSGASCKNVCEGEARCRAYTYVRPGYLVPGARCYLKDRITRPRHKPCCISGVVR